MPTVDAHTPSNKASRAGWTICVLLLIALGVTAWFAWKQGTATPVLAAPSQPSEERAKLQSRTKELEALRATLLELLKADPCAIPPEVEGLSLAAAKAPEAAVKGAAAAQPEPKPQAEPASGKSTASNDEIEAATTLVLAKDKMGTGFFVAPGIVATNRHVVGDAANVVIINKAIGRATRGTVIALSREEERDYALIRVEAGARPMPDPLPLCGIVKKTDKVGSWGFPGVLSKSDPKFQALVQGDLNAVPEEVYSEGVVNVIYDTAPPMILHTATTSHGNSGGPLVNAQGCVVGISTMIHQDAKSYRQTNIALASGDLATFLWQNGITPRYFKGK